MTFPEGVRIAPALPEHIPSLMRGLTAGQASPSQVDYYSALRENDVVGGISLQLTKVKTGSKAVFEMTLMSEAPEGTGNMLVQAAKVLARKSGALSLRYSGSIPEGKDLAILLERCYFYRADEAVSTFQSQLDHPNWERFSRTVEKLRQRNRIQDNTTIVPLNKVDAMAANHLVQQTIGGAGHELMGELLNPDTYSRAVLEGSSLVGLLVATRKETDLYISLMAIPSDQRNTWIYPLLILEVYTEIRKTPECTTCTFKTNPGIHRAILNLAKRVDAVHVRDEYSWSFPLLLEDNAS